MPEPEPEVHYATFTIRQGRLAVHITCTAPTDALCRLDCAVDGCAIETRPPHTSRDGHTIHPAVDSGTCRVVEALEAGASIPAAYEGIPGPVGTVPVDAWLGEAGPGWDLIRRPVVDGDARWTARDEAGWQVQHGRRATDAEVQFRAGYSARLDMDGAL